MGHCDAVAQSDAIEVLLIEKRMFGAHVFLHRH